MLVLINAFKSISRSKVRNILIGIIVLAIAASSCVALAIRNAAHEAEIAAEQEAEANAEAARLEKEATEADIKALLNITGSVSVDFRSMMEAQQAEMGDERGFGGGGGRGGMTMLGIQSGPELDVLLDYADSDLVKDFHYSSSISLDAVSATNQDGEVVELEAYDDGSGSSDDYGGMGGMPGGGMMMTEGGGGGGGPRMIMGGRMTQGDFTVTGYSAEEAMAKFVSGTATMEYGEMFDISSDEMNCIISYELAWYNDLSVGDEITLSNPSADDEEYTFTIVGIYTDTTPSSDTGGMPMFSTAQDPANLICISYGALQTILDYSESVAETGTNDWGMETTTALNKQDSHTFVFSDFAHYESFKVLIESDYADEYYTVTSSDVEEYNRQITEIENSLGDYEVGLAPIQNLSEFATTLFFVILAVGSVILIVINVFNIRERKYEVGVLTAIGIKKGKVAMQFVTELLCVTLTSIIIGSVVGAAVSVPIAQNLLSDRIEQMKLESSSSSESDNQERSFGRPGGEGMPSFEQGGEGGRVEWFTGDSNIMSIANEEVNYLEQINATINLMIMLQLLAIGIVLTFVSSLAAVVFVMRYEPLKILANRA